ncbi:hypothetical protein CPC08DRAFT_771130 [Agrocybe pediades]|nr:hypothetical protein CPC08DRAFT_771130 [Agrocybe pediades]
MPSSPAFQQQVRNRAVLEGLLAESTDTETRLRNLAQANQRHRTAINEALNDTVPLNSVVPQEIITEIFSLVRQDQLDRRAQGSFASLPTPFLLSQVCRAWRNGVRANVRLWNVITIQLSPRTYEKQVELIKFQLIRAGSSKLDIYIERGTMDPPEELFNLLLETSSQWRTFDSIGFGGLSKALSRRGYIFPSLRTLILKDCLGPYIGDYDFTRTEQLDTLVFDRSGSSILQHESLFAWNQLRSLTLNTRVGAGLISKLQYFVRLEKLTLTLSSVNQGHDALQPFDSTSQSPLLPCLTQLTIIDPSPFDRCASRFLEHVNAPKLKRLTVDSLYIHWINSVKNSKDLEELTVFNAEYECTALASIKNFPSLVKLTIHSARSSLSDEFIELLNPVGGDSNLQKLTSIQYYGGKISFSLDAMTAMLRNRLAHSTTHGFAVLKTFDIKYTNRRWAQDITSSDPNAWGPFYLEVARLAASGTTLNITCVQT